MKKNSNSRYKLALGIFTKDINFYTIFKVLRLSTYFALPLVVVVAGVVSGIAVWDDKYKKVVILCKTGNLVKILGKKHQRRVL